MVFFHFRFCSSSLEDRLLENLYQQRLLRLSIRFRRDAAMVALYGAIVLLFVLKSIVLAVLRCREQLPQLGASLDPFSLNETVPNPVIRSRILSICLTLPPMPPLRFSRRTAYSIANLLHFGELSLKGNVLLLQFSILVMSSIDNRTHINCELLVTLVTTSRALSTFGIST